MLPAPDSGRPPGLADAGLQGAAGVTPPPPTVGPDPVGDGAIPPGALQPDGGGDLGLPDASVGCQPNPADSGSCVEICPEVCNGEDDDCDGSDDEGADRSCSAPHAESSCARGRCLLAECKSGYRDCDGKYGNGCEAADDDVNNCGTCGHECDLPEAISACEDGACVAIGCTEGFGDCDGDALSCELSTHTLTDCGECDTPCGDLANALPQCDDGTCAIDHCLGNYGDCDGMAESGCEQKLDNLENCAGCDVPCAKASCAGGVCSAIVCADPLADCDGDEVDCEIDTSDDVANCGGCALPCEFSTATPSGSLECVASACQTICDLDFGDCDDDYRNGCETPLPITADHCGGCGMDCAELLPHVATGSCAASTCGVVTCDSGWEDCDANPSNGCERDNALLGPCHPDANCTRVFNGTHEYHFCTTARTRDDARTKCRSQARGDLVHIDDATENAFVNTNRGAPTSWLGGGDGGREGTFRWLDDGFPFWKGVATGTAVLGSYTSFGSGEPNDYMGGEDCLEMVTGGVWNDQGCTATRAFICEVRPDDCAADSTKLAPGQCGCGMADTDTDADGFADCVESCDNDVNKQAVGACGCGTADTNTDGDAQADCNETCDTDPLKTVPGICGCGTADANTDSDSQLDCIETCDTDPLKLAPGACGCGVADTNTDADSQPDCSETCDMDPAKLAPGLCGCGVADTNTDGDSQPNCSETCDTDPLKLAPGACGCGVAETNTDGDAAPDCTDACDADPSKTTACLGWAPANFDPNTINWSVQPNSTLNCGATVTINTTDPDGAGAMIATITGWCGTVPTPVMRTQSGGPDMVVLPLKGLSVPSGTTLRLIGNRPLIIAVDGNATIGGVIDANGSGTTAGAGGNWSCGTSTGGNSSGGDCTGGSEGGGGGGFGTIGGRGGDGGGGTFGAGGVARGNTNVVPLYGGCLGGTGGGDGTDAPAGAGGGAVQITVSGTLTITGTVRANGSVGSNGSCGNESGGGGGGSGGAIVLEATTVTTTGATITVNGGKGGNSGSGASGGNGSTSSGSNGSAGGNDAFNGGGGGGGGYGRLRTIDH